MKKSSCTVSALLLAAMLLASGQSLVSCGNENGKEEKPTDTQSQTDAGTEEPFDYFADRMKVDDGVPTEDYQKRPFRMLSYMEESKVLDEGTGEVVGDAIYQRTLAIEERFNIQLESVTNGGDYAGVASKLNQAIMSGDDDYQLFCNHVIEAGRNVRSDQFKNWYDLPYVDFTKPWWPDSNIEDLTYDDKAFLAVGTIAQSTLSQTWSFFFNKELAAAYDIPNMYEIVNSGRWTVDKLMSLCKDVYKDLNGDSQQDLGDQYAYALNLSSPQNTYLWALGEKLVKRQADGTPYLDYYNDKVTDIYEKLRVLTFETNGAFGMDYSYSGGAAASMFLDGRLLFLPSCLGFADSLRNFEPDYGIIPYPKYDDAQEEYYTMIDGSHEMLAVPVSIQDEEFVGSVIEALEAETWKRVVPAYVDVTLKVKGTRDEESVAMLDYILNHVVCDFGYVYGGWGAAFWPQYLAETKSSDIASYYASHHKTYDKTIQKVLEYFEEY